MFVRNILLIVGFAALVGGAALTVLWITASPSANDAATATQVARQSILIAAHPIATGTLLRTDDVAWKDVLPADVSAANLVHGRITEADYIGAVARRDFSAGEALIAAAIVKRNERGFLAAVLSPGMRAVSISVDAPQSASGLILPGDHVDVILTQSVGNSPANAISETVAETVLRDLRVIAVDQTLSSSPQAPPASATVIASPQLRIPKTVTLEVSERDAEKLFVAGALGKLDLAVRALESTRVSAGDAATGAQPMWGSDVSAALKNLHREPPRPSEPPSEVTASQHVQASPAQPRLEVMHGAKTDIR